MSFQLKLIPPYSLGVPYMLRSVVLGLLLGVLLLPVSCRHGDKTGPKTAQEAAAEAVAEPAVVDPELEAWEHSTVFVNEREMGVWWSDGDSFKFKTGPHKGSGVRLQGYNSLESYGPVHRWGEWTTYDLFKLAKSSKQIGMDGTWRCTSDEKTDSYGRLLVDCPDLSEAMIRAGHGHVFEMGEKANESLVQAQLEAQEAGAGMWEKGVPAIVLTSLHSVEEGKGYNRRVDSKTGLSTVRQHSETYEVCQEVCEGPEGGQSCMVYVPYSNRYRDRPDCLR